VTKHANVEVSPKAKCHGEFVMRPELLGGRSCSAVKLRFRIVPACHAK
jgi:hypothetical protein